MILFYGDVNFMRKYYHITISTGEYSHKLYIARYDMTLIQNEIMRNNHFCDPFTLKKN